MDTKQVAELLYTAAVEARKLHQLQLMHLDNLVAVADTLVQLLDEQQRPMRVVR